MVSMLRGLVVSSYEVRTSSKMTSLISRGSPLSGRKKGLAICGLMKDFGLEGFAASSICCFCSLGDWRLTSL